MRTTVDLFMKPGIGIFITYIDPFTKQKVRKSFLTWDEAEEYRAALLKRFNPVADRAKDDLTVEELLLCHLNDNPETSLATATGLISDFQSTFGHLKIESLTSDTLKSWLTQRALEGDLKTTTMNGQKVKLNIFFRDMLERGVIKANPMVAIFYKRRPLAQMRKPILLSDEALKNLTSKAQKYSPGLFYPLFLVFIETGAKAKEIQDLTWDCVNFAKGMINLPGGKVLQPRSLPMSDELCDSLSKKIPNSDFVFETARGDKLSKRSLTDLLNGVKRHLGIKEKWAYFDLRHSVAHNLIRREIDLKQVQYILGVKKFKTLEEVYLEPFANTPEQKFERQTESVIELSPLYEG